MFDFDGLNYFVNNILQAIPRTVLFDTKTKDNLLQWPVEEVEKLRMSGKNIDAITIDAGSVLPLDLTKATQVAKNLRRRARVDVESQLLTTSKLFCFCCSWI